MSREKERRQTADGRRQWWRGAAGRRCLSAPRYGLPTTDYELSSLPSAVCRLPSLSRLVGAHLRARGLTIATAESCTGGAVAAALAAIPGASDYLRGGIIAYHADVKRDLLGVPASLIAEEGVVSAACALAMAQGARAACAADVGLATTGIAGPGGAEPGKPVGLVHLAVVWSTRSATRHTIYPGDRAAVIAAATVDALRLIDEVGRRQTADGSEDSS